MHKILKHQDLLNPNTYCLLLTVDDHNSINNQRLNQTNEFPSRNYIMESIRCITAWRKRGGYLADIRIIIDYIGSSELTDEVIEFYMKNKVTVVYSRKHYEDFMKDYDYGFVGVHLTGYHLSKTDIVKPIIIHIDLDMELLQPIPPRFFEPLLSKECIIGGYREEDLPSQRTPLFNNSILNSDLIVTKSHEYTDISIYGEFLFNITIINQNYEKYQIPSNKEYRLFDIEEYGVDKSYAERPELYHVVKEDSYEQGEGYFEATNIDLSKVYFWHEHILDKPNEYFTLQKLKLQMAIKKHQREMGWKIGPLDEI